MANPYYLVAYGHVVRISDRCGSPKAAMRDTFGIDSGCAYLKVTGKGWRYLSPRQRSPLMVKVQRAYSVLQQARENGLVKLGESCDADAIPHAWTAGERKDDASEGNRGANGS